MAHPEHDLIDRIRVLNEVFRPSAPVDHQDLFSGRTQQLLGITTAMGQAGRHVVIFGERGVGKTSLARVAGELMSGSSINLRLTCDQSDNFASIWAKAVDELTALTFSSTWKWGERGKEAATNAVQLLGYESVGPDKVRHFLRILSEVAPVVVFIDEFDRVVDAGTHALIADTIKTLSDQLVRATIVVVGVADDIDSLISEHASIERALAQVPMPRMTPDEVQGIFNNGFSRLDLTTSTASLGRLVSLPQGLPHFAHLLGLEAATPAVYGGRSSITDAEVHQAVTRAITNTDESMTSAYVEATSSSHDTLYATVLLACALTPGDDLGYFSMGDVRQPMLGITKEVFEIPRFARHMVQFCDERGPVLERRGRERKWRYRFINPMMRPYVIMRAYDEGTSEEILGLPSAPSAP